MQEVISDEYLMKHVTFDENKGVYDWNGYNWGKYWTSFSVYKLRKQQLKSHHPDADVFSFALWMDAGEAGRFSHSSSLCLLV